jgi:myo-inositol-1(or 4)-monophosphatase
MALKSATINVMFAAAKKAARVLVRDFGEVEQLQVSKKGPSDFVTAADLRAERILTEELTRARPTYGVLAEERGATNGADANARRWLIDPLDGTTNFLHGIPHFAISLALAEGDEVVAGVVYDPIRDEMFWAERGAGAYVNDRRLRVSARDKLADAVIATGIPHHGRDHHDSFLKELPAVMAACAGVRRFGAAALDLAYVAAGRYDAFWERGLKPWDIAAGLILVREAGGFVTDFAGSRNPLASGDVVAANDPLHRPLLRLLADARA